MSGEALANAAVALSIHPVDPLPACRLLPLLQPIPLEPN